LRNLSVRRISDLATDEKPRGGHLGRTPAVDDVMAEPRRAFMFELVARGKVDFAACRSFPKKNGFSPTGNFQQEADGAY
jgi:hypothetical protein